MRSFLPAYDLIAPAILEEALAMLEREPGKWRPLAGGTDLMVLFESGKLPSRKLLGIWRMPELKGIQETSDSVSVGALTTYTEVRRHPLLAREFPLLAEAASLTGGIATQNRGTLGGNIANASPAADSGPAFLAYDAEIELVSSSGSRHVGYADFHTGYKTTIMRPDELIRSIRLPRNTSGARQYLRRVGTRKAQAISKVSMAAVAHLENGSISRVRIALGSVAPMVIRCHRVEGFLEEKKLNPEIIAQAKRELAQEIGPIDDIRSTASYRSRVAENLLEEFLSKC